MFALSSDITVGSYRFRGAHEVRTKMSIHSYVQTAHIKLPSIAVLLPKTNGSNTQRVVAGTVMHDGDAVTINLGYNGVLKNEFKGFVVRRDLNMPLEIECEGYSYLMRRNVISKSWTTVSVKELMQTAVSGIAGNPISVVCTVDMHLSNVAVKDVNGIELLDFILSQTDNALTIFFINPTTLWCGLTYTAASGGSDIYGLGKVNYRIGYNTVKDNALKEKVMMDNPAEVIFHKTMATGSRISGTSAAPLLPQSKKYRKVLSHIADQLGLKQLAQEKQYRLNYTGLEGTLNAFLQPYCMPGWLVNLVDSRYPEKQGVYVVDDVEVHYGMEGARRMVKLGPLLGFGAV